MDCQRCQHANRAGAKFCENCGAPIAAACARCGAELTSASKFCPECGAPVASAAAPSERPPARSPQDYTPRHLAERILISKSALEGERKQVTVLFADLKGSLELLAGRDPEEARAVLDPVVERMMEAVHHYEGTVNQVMGDGIMALFGAPIANEDHAVRACFAALRMQAAIKRYSEEVLRTKGVPISIRVGLNSGEVVVRSVGSDLRTDYTAVGSTTHLAARLEAAALPGAILISADTLRLAQGYIEAKSLGRIAVKGLAEPVEMHELTGAGPARTRLQAAATRGLTHFVGRSAEMDQLSRAAQLALAGRGQVVAVPGEAGVGKSRLFLEFTRSHCANGWLCLQGSSVSYGKASVYGPVSDLLKNYFEIEDRADLREISEKLTTRLCALDRSLESLLPPFLALLGAPVDDPGWTALDPKQRRNRTVDSIKRLLLRESKAQPLVVIFEDLHWIDGETQAVLDSLVEALPAARILLLVNYRLEYQHGWGSKTYYTQVHLDTLAPQSTSDLLAALLGSDAALASLKALLVERTGGNPFFLEESVRTLAETGLLSGEPGARRLTRPLETIDVPASVQAVLAARIDRLPEAEKRLLQAASAIGKDVPFAVLQEIVDAHEEELRRDLASLQGAEFLYETQLFPDLEYTFKHALTHEVAYGSLLQEQRRTLHSRIVAAIESLYAERLTEQAERLAHHAVRAGLNEKAVRYLRIAGVRALESSAYREAIEFLKHGQKLLDALPDDASTADEALGIRMALGPALMAVSGHAVTDVEANYLQALQLVDRLGDEPRRFPAVWGLWYVSNARGETSRAFRLAQQAFGLAERGAEAALLIEGHHAMWTSLISLGRSADAAEHCRHGVDLYDRQERHSWWSYGTHDPGVCARQMLGVTSWLLGRPDVAAKWSQDAVDLADDLHHDFSMMMSHHTCAWIYFQRGEFDRAADCARIAAAFADTHGFAAWPPRSNVIAGAALVEQGRIEEGLAAIERAVRHLFAVGQKGWHELFCITLLAHAYGKAGNPGKGLEVLDTLSTTSDIGFYDPEVRRVRGELILSLSPDATAQAQQHFRAAIEQARARQEKSLELRAATSLARLLEHDRQRGAAREALAPVYASFNDGLDTADLRQARALLAELS
jgi:class 3 adenylate cyclase/tetratricopeptide (TPR) repeat protein